MLTLLLTVLRTLVTVLKAQLTSWWLLVAVTLPLAMTTGACPVMP